MFLQWFGYYKPGQTSQKNTLQESALYKEVTPLSLFICFLCILWKTFFMFAFVDQLVSTQFATCLSACHTEWADYFSVLS